VGQDEGLPRGSSLTFEAQAPKDIGELRRCFVARAKSGYTNTGDGWFLEMVEVQGPHQEVYQFPCHGWFGHSDCGDYVGALGGVCAGCCCMQLVHVVCASSMQPPNRMQQPCMPSSMHGENPHAPPPHPHATPLHATGALERNLIPVKADHKLPNEEIVGEPVRVQAAGLAFPHPDKVCGRAV